ncbi:FtsX-like permease family protein [Terriglobus albidus]|uniref:FtsX-like permease family protein n=1 Tax=Terriglobus albidus TaxID=1592106 RepID=A0A5B9EFJ6_9BACT|nr:ABC transporter permease [Terriglobus albidus]QEE29117.1 FtsX-like permease family protein [Terriglobus albidus]
MVFPNALVIAWKALRRNRMQTALTMLGMTIGVATVLTMIALGSGAQKAIQDQVKAAGMNMLLVTAGNYQAQRERPPDDAIEMGRLHNPETGMKPHLQFAMFHPEDDPFAVHDHPTSRQRLGDSEAGLGAAATLTLDDAEAVRKIKGVQYAVEGVHENVHVSSGDTRWFTRVHGDGSALPEIRRSWKFTHGGFFSARQQRNKEQVVVLGSIVAEKLFGDKSPVGETVTLWKQPFKVVGVVTSANWMVTPEAGDDQFDAVYIPVTTMQSLLNLSKLNDITVTTESTGDVTRVAKTITTVLRSRHGIDTSHPDDFTVTSQASKALLKGGLRPDVAQAVTGNVGGLEKVTLDQLGKTLDKSSKTMTALLASIATVSLIVGGIGIMNIMMLSVTERTREIGIRRAVGAREKEVLMQFIYESVTLSVVGGLLGILIGVVAAISISHVVQWSTSISPLSIVLSFGISAAVGIFFGYYPAREASRVAPLTSLRFE